MVFKVFFMYKRNAGANRTVSPSIISELREVLTSKVPNYLTEAMIGAAEVYNVRII